MNTVQPEVTLTNKQVILMEKCVLQSIIADNRLHKNFGTKEQFCDERFSS